MEKNCWHRAARNRREHKERTVSSGDEEGTSQIQRVIAVTGKKVSITF
jgi:hypothetical protein